MDKQAVIDAVLARLEFGISVYPCGCCAEIPGFAHFNGSGRVSTISAKAWGRGHPMVLDSITSTIGEWQWELSRCGTVHWHWRDLVQGKFVPLEGYSGIARKHWEETVGVLVRSRG